MTDIIAEQSTTLPEGAIISVVLGRNKTKRGASKAFTEIRARRADDMIKMRLSHDVSPHALPTLLTMSVKQIEKERKLVKSEQMQRPTTFKEFVSSMMNHDMFLSPILEGMENGSQEVESAPKPKRKKRKVKK